MLGDNAMAEKVPRLVVGVDIRKFKLDPMDGFVLTRVNGRLGIKELATETGLGDFSVERSIEKLEKLGVVIRLEPGAPDPAPVAPPPKEQPRSAVAQFSVGLVDAKYDPKELEAPADLPIEQKKRILDFFYRLDDLDHYTLLGVTREAEKKAIKRAYFELAAIFHPDRYYKKDLGTFKPKMEVLFTRITEAHDTLIDVEKRADYDAYVQEVASTRGMEAMLERAIAESEAKASAAATVSVPAPPPSGPAMPSAPPKEPSLIPGPERGPSPEEIRARKEALARRLTGGGPRPGSTVQASQPPPPVKSNPLRYSNPHDAMDAIKRRYEDRVESATAAQARKYIQAADDAVAKKDVVAAASALHIATKFAPDDVELAMRYQETKNQADTFLNESYTKQASYEERQGHWVDAAKSWQKVAKIRTTDAKPQERAANALLRSDGDLHEAAEYAKRAIAIEPTNVEHHLTLVEIYMKAGLAASARRAAETAQSIDPKNPAGALLMKKFGR